MALAVGGVDRLGDGQGDGEVASEASILHSLATKVVEGARAREVLITKLIELIKSQLGEAFYPGCCDDIKFIEDNYNYGSSLRFQVHLRSNRPGNVPVEDMIAARPAWLEEIASVRRSTIGDANFLAAKLAAMFGWQKIYIANYPPMISCLNFSVDLN